ncbi:DUF3667 domain-containing protein [Flagellimonas profundi]|uniref:DUF3667 domain-containing protein n=1 Tax=Flagellimonas profundi TaxID=2915620 RepID=A0ABS3FBE3_9FLAO|nr:DUF3667 domain-containing protein [Allomuricauda profundi]MBO0340343.1 DUF3667 domain-containing protein [Allomuricauda profundi]
MKCKNCNNIVGETHSYCPYCGQKMGLGRLNFKQLLKDLWISFTNTDQGILHLIKHLAYRPGEVAREYISGRRKSYFNPFNYLLITVAIALYFIAQFEVIALDYSKIESDDKELLQFAFRYFNVFILLMWPIHGFLIWLFFKGRETNYVENLTFTAYLSGQTMLYYILALALFMMLPSLLTTLGTIIGLLISIWYMLAILQFYQTKSFWSILKIILIITLTNMISQGIIFMTFQWYRTWFV